METEFLERKRKERKNSLDKWDGMTLKLSKRTYEMSLEHHVKPKQKCSMKEHVKRAQKSTWTPNGQSETTKYQNDDSKGL